MPAQQSSHCLPHVATGALPESMEYNIHNFTQAYNLSCSYPTSDDWYCQSNTNSPIDSFKEFGMVC